MTRKVKARREASRSPHRQFDQAAFDQLQRFVQDLGQMYRERNEALAEVTKAHTDALLRLAVAADYKDDDTGVHIVRIGYLSEALALRLGQTRAWAELLRMAAPMHDIGKLGIPDAILKKPGKLDPPERIVMNKHPEIGAEILGTSREPLIRLAAQVAMTHHEKWDGTGYPNGLSGTQIPLAGRIVSIVDFFDALTMDRVYRKAFDDATAIRMLQEQSGRAFDPGIVAAFEEALPSLIRIRETVNAGQPSYQALKDMRFLDVAQHLAVAS